MSSQREDAIVIGAGPAGLAAGYELVKQGVKPLVLEKSSAVGGMARTEACDGYRFDVGPHRFFTKDPEVQKIWEDVLGDNFIRVPRLTRIFYGGKFYDYPLNIAGTLRNLGVLESAGIVLSFIRWRLFPYPTEETFDRWVTNRFGKRLFETFFKVYTEKVWGTPCHEIQAEWAAQRIQGLSLAAILRNALSKKTTSKSLIKQFHYPRLGAGALYEAMAKEIEDGGGIVAKDSPVEAVHVEDNAVVGVTTNAARIATETLVSSMPLSELIAKIRPPAPEDIRSAAATLRYRDILIVYLFVSTPDLFPDNWIYVHSPEVMVSRISNYRNWSAAMAPSESNACLGMEYFCNEGDEIWNKSDEHLLSLAKAEIARLGLVRSSRIDGGAVIRQAKAYPVYDGDYKTSVEKIAAYISSVSGLQTIGRNGLHRYNNMDHSMLTGLYAARNINGGKFDVWSANTEQEYHEEISKDPAKK